MVTSMHDLPPPKRPRMSGMPGIIPSLCVLAASACLAIVADAAAAQETDLPGLSVELNAVAPMEDGCTLSFLISNGHAAPIEQVVFEAVLFDPGGQVDRLTLFDFGALPPGRPRVRQFTLPDTSCEAIGRILVDGASTCEAPGLGEGACTDGLRLSTRAGIEVIG